MENKLKKNSKKGFTLVELIVVLVILAILAALLIPSLTGYIKKAKEKQIIAETRQVVMAAQTLADEAYAKGTSIDPAWVTTNSTAILDLAEVTGTISNPEVGASGNITKLTFNDGAKGCIYDASSTDKYTPQ